MSIAERFDQRAEEYLKASREVLPSRSSDLAALVLLDSLFPGEGQDIITAAEHDVVYLRPTREQIETLTDQQIITLRRYGVSYDRSLECLYMFT